MKMNSIRLRAGNTLLKVRWWLFDRTLDVLDGFITVTALVVGGVLAIVVCLVMPIALLFVGIWMSFPVTWGLLRKIWERAWRFHPLTVESKALLQAARQETLHVRQMVHDAQSSREVPQ